MRIIMKNKTSQTIRTQDLLIRTAGKLFTRHGIKGGQAKDIAQRRGSFPLGRGLGAGSP